jgi:phosphonate transport system substrate-binding protein
MNSLSRVLAGLLLVTLASAAPAADQPTAVLRFTALPDHNATELKQKYDPVARHLSSELGINVAYVPAADYQASVEMFKNGDVMLAWFGGLTGVQARRAVPGARAIVQGAEDAHYHSYFIAHESTGLERSEQFPSAIASLPFSFGSESSTSGRLMPEFFIRKHSGKSPKEFFSEPFGFSGSHPKTAELVSEGTKVKAGVLNYMTYDSMVADGRIDPETCRIIWKTPPYADYNFTAHPDIDKRFGAGTIDRLQDALTAIEDKALLAAFQRTGLIKAANAEFNGIANIAVELGMLR